MKKLNIDIGSPHVEGHLLRRINRFVVSVMVNGKTYHAHLHDSGRLGELLIEGTPIMLIPHQAPKTDFKVIAIYREGYGWILLNSGMHRRIMEAILSMRVVKPFQDIISYQPEYKIENHRIDFLLKYPTHEALMEVKGCTLFRSDICLFPDAPTKRGKEHVEILARHTPSFITFLVCHPEISHVVPNCHEDQAFCDALKRAVDNGVQPLAIKIAYKDGAVWYAGVADVKI